MAETLFHAYLPLVLWIGLGVLIWRWVPQSFPKLLGRALYWVGVPWQIFALARHTHFSTSIGLAPTITVGALGIGLVLAWLSLKVLSAVGTPYTQHWQSPARSNLQEGLNDEDQSSVLEGRSSWFRLTSRILDSRSRQGSFFIAATIGNTGFVGLGLVPSLIGQPSLSWAVFYSVTQNVVGTYGVGVFLASYFGRPQQANHWWVQVRDVLSVPSLWAFAIGSLTRSITLPEPVELGLHAYVWFVIPAAFLLMGLRLSQLHGWQSIQLALLPTVLKVGVLPALVGIIATLLGVNGDPRLALVLMSGMPSAFAGLILAEEYELDRELIASSIVLSTIVLLLTIPLWLALFS